jgi:hypothetical protein
LVHLKEGVKRMKKGLILAAVLSLLAVASHAQATVLSPGDSGVMPVDMMSAVNFATLTGETLMGTKSSLGVAGTFTAEMTSQVYKGGSGYLDFVYTVKNDGPDSIRRVTMSTYPGSGYTDVYWVEGSSVAPHDADRSSLSLGFNFPLGPSTELAAGGTVTLVVRTHDIAFGGGLLNAQDGSNTFADSFSPAPLPSSFVLLGTGILSLAGSMVRRMRRQMPLMA